MAKDVFDEAFVAELDGMFSGELRPVLESQQAAPMTTRAGTKLAPSEEVFDNDFLRELNDLSGGELFTKYDLPREKVKLAEPLDERIRPVKAFADTVTQGFTGGLESILNTLDRPDEPFVPPTETGSPQGSFLDTASRIVPDAAAGIAESAAPALSATQDFAQEFLRRSIVPLGKAGAQGIQAVGGLIDFLAPLTPGLSRLYAPELARISTDVVSKAGRSAAEFGQESSEILNQISPVDSFVTRNKEGKLRPNVEALKNPETWTDAIITTIGSIAQSIAAGGGTAVGASIAGGVLESGPMFNDLMASGMNRAEASARSLAFGTIVAGLNKISFDKFMKGASGPTIKKALVAAFTEAWTEGAEEPWQAILTNLGRKGITLTQFGESLSDSLTNAVNVFIPSLFGGFVASGGGNVQSPFQQPAQEPVQPPPLPTEETLQAPPAQADQALEPAPVQTPPELAPAAEGAAISEEAVVEPFDPAVLPERVRDTHEAKALAEKIGQNIEAVPALLERSRIVEEELMEAVERGDFDAQINLATETASWRETMEDVTGIRLTSEDVQSMMQVLDEGGTLDVAEIRQIVEDREAQARGDAGVDRGEQAVSPSDERTVPAEPAVATEQVEAADDVTEVGQQVPSGEQVRQEPQQPVDTAPGQEATQADRVLQEPGQKPVGNPKPEAPGAPVSPATESYFAGVPAENVIRDIDTVVSKLGRLIPKKTDPSTPKQRRQIISLQNRLGFDAEVYERAVREVSKGRTTNFEELNKGEAAAYREYLKRELGDAPDSQLMKEGVLRDFSSELETEMQQARKPQDRKLTIREKLGRQFWDIDRVMSDLQEETGQPFFSNHNEVNRSFRDATFEAGEEVKALFDGLGVDFKFLLNNVKAEARIFEYLNTGKKPAGMTDIELRIADRMDATFRKSRPLVKRIRHQRYMRDGTIPADSNKAQMDEGARVLKEEGEAAYDSWINREKFGIREFYAPTHGKQTPNLNSILETKFGRGFTKGRTQAPEYDPAHPLLGDFYRYVRRAKMIETVEPKLIQLEEMFNKEGVEAGLFGRYMDNMYGRNFQNDLDFMQASLTKGMRQFFRVQIPQKLGKWIPRNLLQPTAMTLPRVVSPLNPTFWRNLPKLYTGALKMRNNKKIGWGKFLVDEDTRNYFQRYVTSLDQARQHYTLQEMSEFETVRDFMHLMDEMSRAYGWSDTVNRANTFVFGYDSAIESLQKFQKNPTRANWNKFLDVTGFSLAPRPEQMAVARLVEEGNIKEASYTAAKRLADATQFRYPRAERGLAWQKPGTGGSITAPIATFWKGQIQGLYKDGLKPLGEGLRAEAEGTATAATRNRTKNAAVTLMSWYAASLLVNRLYEWMYDVDEGTYGLNSLRFTPGGPVIQNYVRLADTLWGAVQQDNGWGGKVIAAIDGAGDAFLPFYHMLNKIIATRKGQTRFSIPFAVRDAIQRWLARRSGSKNPRDQRRWVERTAVEQAQSIVMGGSWATRKQDLLDEYQKYMDIPEEDVEAIAKQREKVTEALRKYPVSTKRKDIPRTLENIDELVPSFWESLDKNAKKKAKEK
ncbi:MAG: hypothetical protein ACYTEQ_01090 [Planctomycetota bacterium]|jgi:hypothetical protein